MRSFDLLADSSCDLPLEVVKEFDVNILPMNFTLGEDDYQEDYWTSITPDKFYSRIKSGEKAMTTQISGAMFLQAYSEHLAKGRDVLFICLSRGLSASYDNACTAAADAMLIYPGRKVRVINSISATIGHGLLTILAAQKSDNGASVDETADYLEDVKHRCYALFTVDDLMFLHKGGRLSRFSAIAGSMLGVKPMLWVDVEGSLKLRSKVRGRKTSLDSLADNMGKCITAGRKPKLVTIAHGNCAADAEYLKKVIEERFSPERIIVTMLGAVVGTHSGPGTMAMFFEGDFARAELEEK